MRWLRRGNLCTIISNINNSHNTSCNCVEYLPHHLKKEILKVEAYCTPSFLSSCYIYRPISVYIWIRFGQRLGIVAFNDQSMSTGKSEKLTFKNFFLKLQRVWIYVQLRPPVSCLQWNNFLLNIFFWVNQIYGWLQYTKETFPVQVWILGLTRIEIAFLCASK